MEATHQTMGWLLLVGASKVYVSFAKKPYKTNYILQKRPIIVRKLLIIATPYVCACVCLCVRAWVHISVCVFVCVVFVLVVEQPDQILCVCSCGCVWVWMHVWVCVYDCVGVCVWVCVGVCVCVRVCVFDVSMMIIVAHTY